MRPLVLIAAVFLFGRGHAQALEKRALEALNNLQPKQYTFADLTEQMGHVLEYSLVQRGCDRPGCFVEHMEVAPDNSSVPIDTAAWLDFQAWLACIQAELMKQEQPAVEP